VRDTIRRMVDADREVYQKTIQEHEERVNLLALRNQRG
jgi:hypothetical protein